MKALQGISEPESLQQGTGLAITWSDTAARSFGDRFLHMRRKMVEKIHKSKYALNIVNSQQEKVGDSPQNVLYHVVVERQDVHGKALIS